MLKLIFALVLCAMLATCGSATSSEPKRDPRYPHCQALYYAMQDEPRLWPPANRVHLCDALAWEGDTAQFTYIHEIYNPDPMDVFAHGCRIGKTEGNTDVGSYLMKIYKKRIEGCCGNAPASAPKAECHEYVDEKGQKRWMAWGTDQIRVARTVCSTKKDPVEYTMKVQGS